MKTILRLSRREREVREQVALGRSNKEIATALGLAEGTIKQYLTQTFRKTGLNRHGLMASLFNERISELEAENRDLRAMMENR